MVPLWPRKASHLPLRGELIPLRRSFKVALYAKYLGFIIGPGAAETRWNEVEAKFRSRVRVLADMPLGMSLTCIAYKCFAVSTLSYVMQLYHWRDSWDRLQQQIAPQLVRGPHQWIHLPWLFDRRSDIRLPSTFVHIGMLHEAVWSAPLLGFGQRQVEQLP